MSTLFISADSRKKLLITSCIITVFTSLGAVFACFADRVIPRSMEYGLPLYYSVSVGILYILLLFGVYMTKRKHFAEIKKYIHVSAFNCAVMGTLFTINGKTQMLESQPALSYYILSGLEAGLGFVTASLVLVSAYRKLSSEKVPASFRGFPAMLIYLGIISMAVYSLGV